MTKLRILFENTDVVVVDKPAGINVHTGHGRESEETLVDQVEQHVGHPVYPVHRLDRDTSGVIIFAMTNESKLFLQKQFEHRSVSKTYLALVEGVPKHEEAELDWPIARHNKNPLKRSVAGSGKSSQTWYRVINKYQGKSLLEVKPKTGRTHQIRVHLAHLGNPVVADSVYGKSNSGLGRQWLHAKSIELKLPDGKTRTFDSPLPDDLQNYLDQL